MNRFLTLLLAASCLTAIGQVEVVYPYNPDNGDGSIGSPDLIELLTLYGSGFQPEAPFVNDIPIDQWMDSIQNTLAMQQALLDSIQQEVDSVDLDACDNLGSINYYGYDYDLVAIGDQCWFAENLRNTHYNNGDEIANSIYSWIGSQSLIDEYQDQGSTGIYGEMKDSVFCENFPIGVCEGGATNLVADPCEPSQSIETYGRVYNGFAVTDERGLCPVGWHVSTDYDWLELEIFAGMLPTTAIGTGERGEQAIDLKSNDGWGSYVDGLNSYGFNALPGGSRDLNGVVWGTCPIFFYETRINDLYAGSQGNWWTPHGDSYVSRGMSTGSLSINRSLVNPHNGFSVRCVKDAD